MSQAFYEIVTMSKNLNWLPAVAALFGVLIAFFLNQLAAFIKRNRELKRDTAYCDVSIRELYQDFDGYRRSLRILSWRYYRFATAKDPTPLSPIVNPVPMRIINYQLFDGFSLARWNEIMASRKFKLSMSFIELTRAVETIRSNQKQFDQNIASLSKVFNTEVERINKGWTGIVEIINRDLSNQRNFVEADSSVFNTAREWLDSLVNRMREDSPGLLEFERRSENCRQMLSDLLIVEQPSLILREILVRLNFHLSDIIIASQSVNGNYLAYCTYFQGVSDELDRACLSSFPPELRN